MPTDIYYITVSLFILIGKGKKKSFKHGMHIKENPAWNKRPSPTDRPSLLTATNHKLHSCINNGLIIMERSVEEMEIISTFLSLSSRWSTSRYPVCDPWGKSVEN